MKLSLLRSVASGLAATSAIALVLGAMPAGADENAGSDGDPGVARLSVLRGDVDLKRADSGDTVPAAVNAPVSAGDYVTTRGDSRAEIQYGYGSAVRVAGDTQLRFTHLDPENHALQLAQGTVEMRVFRGLEAHPEVDTPAATIRPDERGQYRITVTNDGNTELTVRSGRADVITPNGTQTISPNYTLLIEGQGNDLRFQTLDTVALDGFDEWNGQRDGAFEHASDYQYADQGIVGADDLAQYGQWVDNPTYGEVWSPNETAGWSPYQDGRWVWESYYGWTWVGAEAWGYAPYHYGNWFYASNAWFWYPGRANYHRFYSPALVGFFSFGAGGFGVGFGNIGWVPLAPFEAISPWWGRRGFDNRTVVNINIRNVTINNYRNLAVPNAAVAVTNANFANGNFKRLIPLHESELKTIAAVHGVVPVVPTQHNLSPRAGSVASAAAPLSTRFANFKATSAARPPSFTAERETIAAAAQKQYPEHAAAITHPESLPAESSEHAASTEHATATEHAATPERAAAPAESASKPSESSGNAVERDGAAPAARTNEAGPWSRFGDRGTSAPAPRSNASQETPATTSRDQSTDKQSEPRAATKPLATNGGAWSRFNGNGGTTGNAPSHANGYSNDAPRSTVSGSRSASTPATSTSTHASTGRTNYGDDAPSYRQTPAYHAPAYRAPAPAYHAPVPAYHAPAAAHAAAPAPAHHAAPASGGGNAAKPPAHKHDDSH